MKYTLYWRDGKKEVIEGTDPANAMMLAGYSGGALYALDFYAQGEDNSYIWEDKNWHRIQ